MGRFHIVSTPIGNLEDVTLRALRVLREADLVFAEDTRRTRILLDRHAIAARPRSLHAHNEASRVGEALAALDGGGSVVLVSDAGTPLVSDPGARLVAAAIAAGHTVLAIPGPSAVLAALAVSGLPADTFTFLGFLPRRASLRRALLARLREAPETLIFFESPRRVSSVLLELQDALGDRAACVARELTKLHEEATRGILSELAKRFSEGVRGEVTIVVEGADSRRARASGEAGETETANLDERIHALLAEGQSPREISAALARPFGARRREVYARAVRAAAAGRSGT
ncbi:MAG TPA: 16S rRNA (cytidine(1402)-2'-O)-methyltransferase [Myxococcota bacterium]|nr:16S rRNA (cytidine(1402)-2'-O)-methyltransferase [Myxococcota bacterium]